MWKGQQTESFETGKKKKRNKTKTNAFEEK